MASKTHPPHTAILFPILVLVLISVSCSSGIRATLPPQVTSAAVLPTQTSAQAQPTQSPTVIQTPASAPQKAILEARRLTLEWPPTLRMGDSDVVRLTLEVDAQGNLTSTAEIAGHTTTGETVYIENVYDTHTVLAEAWFDIAGLDVRPNEAVSQPLLPGKKVTFFWSISADHVADYRGTVWLKLHFIPLDGSPAREKPISAQVIDIHAVNLAGLGGTSARVLGGAGVLLGSVISLNDIAKAILGWAWKRLRQRKSQGAIKK